MPSATSNAIRPSDHSSQRPAAQKKMLAMNAGNTITSRDSQDVRHMAAARHPRSGWPRWNVDDTRPAPVRQSTTTAPAKSRSPGKPKTASPSTSIRNSPCPAPAMVVKMMTDQAGRMATSS